MLKALEIGPLATVASIRRANRRFDAWLQSHPGGTFADYYVEKNLEQIKAGKVQPSLGPTIEPRHAATAARAVSALQALGLEPHHRLVDYGCGSLRQGRALIAFLDPGCYRGLDISDAFFGPAMDALDPELIERAPRADAISAQTLADVAEWSPDFISSVGVLLHVPPSELEAFFRQVVAMMSPATRAVIKVRTWRPPTVQTSAESWLHSRRVLQSLPEALGCTTELVPMRRGRIRGLGLPFRHAWLRLRLR